MSEARNVYRLLGLQLEEPVSVVGLCVEAIGRKPEWRQQQKESTLELLDDGHHIYVSTRLKPARARWRIGHELAHWYFERINHSSERIEQECDSLGAELCVPRAMVLDAWSRFGTDLRAAAEWLQTTQSLVLLRYGECVVPGVSGTAVLESSKIIARSDWSWPTEEELRQVDGPGVRRVAIDDEPKRVGMIVEELECHVGQKCSAQ